MLAKQRTVRRGYRVSVMLPGQGPTDKALTVICLSPDLRTVYYWAHARYPDADSLTVEAPRVY